MVGDVEVLWRRVMRGGGGGVIVVVELFWVDASYLLYDLKRVWDRPVSPDCSPDARCVKELKKSKKKVEEGSDSKTCLVNARVDEDSPVGPLLNGKTQEYLCGS